MLGCTAEAQCAAYQTRGAGQLYLDGVSVEDYLPSLMTFLAGLMESMPYTRKVTAAEGDIKETSHTHVSSMSHDQLVVRVVFEQMYMYKKPEPKYLIQRCEGYNVGYSSVDHVQASATR